MVIPRKIYFTQMGRYSDSCEQRFRHAFKRKFEWLDFNKALLKRDFAFNASLACINIAKVMRREFHPELSIGLLKSYLSNIYMLNRFFAMSGFRPNMTSNAKLVKELYDLVAVAA